MYLHDRAQINRLIKYEHIVVVCENPRFAIKIVHAHVSVLWSDFDAGRVRNSVWVPILTPLFELWVVGSPWYIYIYGGIVWINIIFSIRAVAAVMKVRQLFMLTFIRVYSPFRPRPPPPPPPPPPLSNDLRPPLSVALLVRQTFSDYLSSPRCPRCIILYGTFSRPPFYSSRCTLTISVLSLLYPALSPFLRPSVSYLCSRFVHIQRFV